MYVANMYCFAALLSIANLFESAFGSCTCPASWINDGECDWSCNNASCDFDGGDCCTCPASWINDGICDVDCNNASCDFDGGDCEASSSDLLESAFGSCTCPASWINDGECDGDCNNASCDFDGGDCEASSSDDDDPVAAIVGFFIVVLVVAGAIKCCLSRRSNSRISVGSENSTQQDGCGIPRQHGDFQSTPRGSECDSQRNIEEQSRKLTGTQFRNDQRSVTWPDGTEYEGQWAGDKKHGHGRLVQSCGTTYVGDFRSDYFHGRGVETQSNGDQYEGDWENGRRHGTGLLTQSNGAIYNGQWLLSVRHGTGVEITGDGDKYDGQWKHGLMNGRGEFKIANDSYSTCFRRLVHAGDIYKGSFQNGVPHGRVLLTKSTGEKYLLTFEEGIELKKNQTAGFGKEPLEIPALPSGKKYHVFLSHTWRNDDEGRDNHKRVERVNEGLKRYGLITWYDGERMRGSIDHQMANGISEACIFGSFLTRAYCEKVNGDNRDDNCQKEFRMAISKLGSTNVIPVAMEGAMLTSSNWGGIVELNLCDIPAINMTSDVHFEEGVHCLTRKIVDLLRR